MIPLEMVEETGSTSEVLKQRATEGDGESALLARRQTAGRGRPGRRWATMEGNLHLSVLLRPGAPVRPGHWSGIAAVALAEALRPFAPALRLKWPNDVMLDGGKLAGILLEAGEDARGGPWLVAGFGVNLAAAPEGLGRAVAQLGGVVGPAAFAPAVLEALAGWRARYVAEGYEPVRAAWLERGPAIGAAVSAGHGAERVEGTFAGLREDGALLLHVPGGILAITSGEVSEQPATTQPPGPAG